MSWSAVPASVDEFKMLIAEVPNDITNVGLVDNGDGLRLSWTVRSVADRIIAKRAAALVVMRAVGPLELRKCWTHGFIPYVDADCDLVYVADIARNPTLVCGRP